MTFQDKEKKGQKQQGELSHLDQVLTLQKGKGEGREAARTKLQTGEAVGGSLSHCKDCSQRNFKARRSDQALAPLHAQSLALSHPQTVAFLEEDIDKLGNLGFDDILDMALQKIIQKRESC